MRLGLLLVLITSTASAAPLTGHVAIWVDAKLIFDPAHPDRTEQLQVGRRFRAWAPQLMPVRVIADRGALLEVTTTPHHCNAGLGIPDLDQARFFVRREDLATVLVKPFRATYADGTSIELDPGTHVEQHGTSYSVELGRHWLPVELPADAVGFAYTPSPARVVFAAKPGDRVYVTRGRASAELAGHRFSETDLRHVTRTPHALARKTGKTLLPIEGRCGRATVAFEDVRSQEETWQDEATAAEEEGARSGTSLPEGTPVFVGAHRIGVLSKPRPITSGRCVQLHLTHAADPTRRAGYPRLVACARS